jgi:glycosyltransferase involved in cell wall biosynthesis
MAKILAAQVKGVHFLLVGSGPEEGHITHLIHRDNLREHFTRRQSLGEIADLYAAMDVVVLTSRVEGFPNVLMEAMAAGKPVVAAAVGGIPELVRHEDNGLLVRDRTAEGFADAVLRTLGDRAATQERISQAWREVRDQYSVPRMVSAYAKYYAELLARAGQG